MKQIAKKTSILIVCMTLLTSPVWGKGIAVVTNTIHNMSTSQPAIYGNTYRSSNVDQVCVFCHTPHGGSLDGPLWNHSAPVNNFTHYNSVTLSGIVGENRPVRNESLICMSCHDGSIAVNTLHNNPNEIGSDPVYLAGLNPNVPIIGMAGGVPAAKIGAVFGDISVSGNLTDDHPISFSYNDVLTAINNTPKEFEIRTVAAAELNGVRFYGPENYVECTSCHDPHVDYVTQQPEYAPFLITPNTGSALCLACHDK